MKIILIDDDEYMGNSIIRGLKSNIEDVDITWLKNADEAFSFEYNINYDFIILDSMMYWGQHFSSEDTDDGYRTGVSILKEINSKNINIPVGILTALQNPILQEIKDYCRDNCPIVKFILEKPQQMKTIALKILNIVNKK